MRIVGITAFVAAVAGGVAQGAVLFEDDFESYADTAAMDAVWGANGLGTLDPTGGFGGGKAMAHPGGTANVVTFAETAPSGALGLRVTGKVFDDASGNKRFSIGVRSATTFPLFEMGMYNGPTNYATRVTLFPGQNPTWTALGPAGSNLADSGWHTFVAEFTIDSIVVTLDLDSNGSIDLSDTFALSGAAYSDGLSILRLGGPSDVTSAGGGGLFDDIRVESFLVPEPASVALLAGFMVVAGTRRRA